MFYDFKSPYFESLHRLKYHKTRNREDAYTTCETVKGTFQLSIHTEGLNVSGLSSCDGSERIDRKNVG